MVARRRLYVTAATLALLAAVCVVVAFLRRHNIEDSLGGIEGAYFSRPAGPSFAGSFGGNVLDPFRIGNAYLWLGASAGLLVAAMAVALVSRFGHSTHPARTPR